MNVSTLTISGNLTKDPQLNQMPNGVTTVTFAIVNNNNWFDKGTNKFVEGKKVYINCKAFGKLAEKINLMISKGNRVLITGRLVQNIVTKPDGTNVYYTDIQVDDIGLSLKQLPKDPEGQVNGNIATYSADMNDDIPF